MATYREIYFKLIKGESKELFPTSVIFSLFMNDSNMSQAEMLLHLDDSVKNEEKINKQIEEIKQGKPYQYVLGYTEFLGQKFYVNENVLIPRQETELLVKKTIQLAKIHFKSPHISVLDMCSGSGVIGICINKTLGVNVTMVDISSKANEVARKNVELHQTNIEVILSDMFSNLEGKIYDVIVCNPPYIKSEETVDNTTLKYEPHLALFASPQTKFYEEVFKQKGKFFSSNFVLAFEIDEDMEEDLTKLIHEYFNEEVKFEFVNDIYGKLRYLFIESI